MSHSCVRAALAAGLAISGGLLVACDGPGGRSGGAVERAIAEGRSEDGWNLAGAAVRADSSSATAWMSQARAGLATLRTAAGVEAANRAVEVSAGDPQAYLLRAYLDQRRFRNVAALAAADTARAGAPDDLSCVRAAGELRLGGGMVGTPDYAGAEVAFRAALALDPTDVRSRFGLGMTLVLVGRENDAMPWLDGVLAERPAWGEVHYLRGLVHMRGRAFEDAARDFENTVRFDPTHAAAWFNRARVLDRLGRNDEANAARGRVAYLRELADRTKSVAVAWHDTESPGQGLQLVRALREALQWEEARQLARTLSVDFPRLPPAALELAEAALAADAPEEARIAAERAVDLAPRNPQARLVASRAAEASGDPAAALVHAREAAALSPEDAECASLLGRLLVATGDAAGALAPLDEVARLGVRDVRVAACRAEAWIALGRNEEAEALLGRLLAAQNRPEWLELRAKALVASGRWTLARDDLRVAVEAEPHRAPAWHALADVLENADQKGEARECRDRAKEIERSQRDASDALAAWRAAPYDPDAARTAVERLTAVERFVDAGRITRIAEGFGERP